MVHEYLFLAELLHRRTQELKTKAQIKLKYKEPRR